MIRPLFIEEVKAASDLADLIYPSELYESLESFEKKFLFYPFGFLGSFQDNKLNGYVIGHPWIGNTVVPLNYNFPGRIVNPDCFYIHDIVVHPDFQGKGYSKELMTSIINLGKRESFNRFMCVAVTKEGKSLVEKFGFHAENPIIYSGIPSWKMIKED